MDIIMNNINTKIFERYATLFPDIDPSIINDVINSTDNQYEMELYLNEINNSIDKTDKERNMELENNLGTEISSELKFSADGTNHIDNLTNEKPKKSLWKRITGSLNRRNANSQIEFQKFDET